MIIPSSAEVYERVASFIKREELTTWRSFTVPKMASLFYRYRFFHFFLTGVGGLALGLALMWALTTFVFGVEGYFTAYLLGAAFTMTFNFIVYSLTVFRTSHRHVMRFVFFILYNIAMTGLQALVIRSIVPLVGAQWYLLIVAGVVFIFSFLNYGIFKLSLFRERPY